MTSPTTTVLDQRALNRALLERQHLLDRTRLAVDELVEHLVGLQAQAPQAPYLQLWSRRPDTDPERVSALLEQRALVRVVLMRSTLHLVTARDARALRALVQPALERDLRSRRGGPDAALTDAIVARGRELLADRALTNAELGQELARSWPDEDPTELVYVVRTGLTLVQVPPRGLWRRSGATAHTTAEAWLGASDAVTEPVPAEPTELVRRYLRAFGPASTKDVQTWAGVTGLQSVVDALAPELRTFRTEDGAVLHDVPDAPLPDPDTPAPPRLVAEFDNLVLSHADRRRVVDESFRRALVTKNGQVRATCLLDGRVAGVWTRSTAGRAGPARVTIEPWTRLRAADRAGLEEEAHRLLAVLEPEREPEVVIER